MSRTSIEHGEVISDCGFGTEELWLKLSLDVGTGSREKIGLNAVIRIR
jgi:hypothetical protein